MMMLNSIDITKYKCCIFDLDGTLIDSTGVWHKVDIDFLEKRGIAIPDDFIEEIKIHTFESGAKYVVERFGLDENPKEIISEWFDMAVFAYDNEIKLKDGVKELLEFIKQQGLKIALATSSDRKLFEKCLKRNGIYDFFDSFTQTSEVARGKSFPDVYECAALKCGVKKEDCIVFEDVLAAVKGAKKGGFFTVAVQDKASAQDEVQIKEAADLYIKNYSELQFFTLTSPCSLCVVDV